MSLLPPARRCFCCHCQVCSRELWQASCPAGTDMLETSAGRSKASHSPLLCNLPACPESTRNLETQQQPSTLRPGCYQLHRHVAQLTMLSSSLCRPPAQSETLAKCLHLQPIYLGDVAVTAGPCEHVGVQPRAARTWARVRGGLARLKGALRWKNLPKPSTFSAKASLRLRMSTASFCCRPASCSLLHASGLFSGQHQMQQLSMLKPDSDEHDKR